MIRKLTLTGFFWLLIFFHSTAQVTLEKIISDSLTAIASDYIATERINKIKIGINQKSSTITITAGENFGQIPFRNEIVRRIYHALDSILTPTYPGYNFRALAYGKEISELIPVFASEKKDSMRIFRASDNPVQFIINTSKQYSAEEGLTGNHLAVWNSHGYYFKNEIEKWIWQRPRLFGTVEDLLTTSFVLPFLVPMLENAGAQVYLPRERDTQSNEIIVDNDFKMNSKYKELNDRYSWETLEKGFSDAGNYYIFGENPFEKGTSRIIKTITDPHESSRVEWIPDIPERGYYAVYVSWQSVENSTQDAAYTVFHQGGKTTFSINQQMMGGTWVYLGHFLFDKGKNAQGKVVLNNLSRNENKIVSADAVKFGGGKGNMASGVNFTNEGEIIPVLSGLPRYAEGSRYWLQWAGFPDSIYSRTHNTNDYSDDFQSRGYWVNYLSGGSKINPDVPGLGVPIDLALAFHTDAGTFPNDTIVGTMGICTVNNNNGVPFFENGVSRWASRDLVDIIQSQVVSDIKNLYRSNWSSRGIWNKSYSESRVPEVPVMLLELLSHQNFTDMTFALDPRFRFTVSRAIYKGILKHIALMYNRPYTVQPLPVNHFSTRFISGNTLRLQWQPSFDSLETTSKPDNYLVYTRIDNGDFEHGRKITGEQTDINLIPGKIYSFKITALNKGGESFPSEILSAYRDPDNRATILIVNGFNRISGPASFSNDSVAGFLTDEDAGVPWLSEIAFTGKQVEFKRNMPFIDNDNPGFGGSASDFEGKIIAGNTFDYPFLHGKAIQSAGFSFVSVSAEAFSQTDYPIGEYKVTDLILGKQKQTILGNVKKQAEFKTFPLDLQLRLKEFCQMGGNLLVSGAYPVSGESNDSLADDNDFAFNTLKIKRIFHNEKPKGEVIFRNNHPGLFSFRDKINYQYIPDKLMYFVENPDCIEPADEKAFSIAEFKDLNAGAGVAYNGTYKTCTFSFPFETIREENLRNKLMQSVLNFFLKK